MKLTQLSAAVAFALASTASIAAKPPTVTTNFNVSSGAFYRTFKITTDSTYDAGKAAMYVSGMNNALSSLTLDLRRSDLTDLTSPDITATKSGQTLKASFADKNHTFDLTPGTSYWAIVSGEAKGSGAAITLSGTYLASITETVIASVPEPETYAMFAVGLGLIGGVARRRAKAGVSTQQA